jgi:hypothetical protein
MNRTLFSLLLLIATWSIIGCGKNSQSQSNQAQSNQNGANAAGSTNNGNTSQAPMPGGYADASTTDAGVAAAADYAATEQSKSGKAIRIKSVERVQQQVVAGTNYRLEVVVDEAGTERKAEVVVYQDLQQKYSLTSWNWK